MRKSSLESNPRKFVYSEVGFLKIYLKENHMEIKKHRIKKLIEDKQWEFVNGGISQPDTACSHFDDLINNYYYGLWFLKRHFGVSSVAAW